MTTKTFSHKPRASSARRGVTLVELLVALAILSVIAVSLAGVFMIVLQSTAETQAQLEATGNARHALEQISTEIKRLEDTTPLLVGTNNTLAYGDLIDNDRDGSIDEETPDGRDDDGDWSDRHATIPATPTDIDERPGGVGVDDWGDAGVDEDSLFSSDTLRFHVEATTTTYDYDEITYSIGTHNGIDHVLVRSVTQWDSGVSSPTTTSALAYGVLSFNVMYWDSNAVLADQTWLADWDSTTVVGTFEYPASVALEIVTYADDRPLDNVNLGGESVKTMTLRTVMNVESVINDSNFDRRP